jgi:hypothetical protein
VLHGRVQRIVGPAEPAATVSYAERTPRIADPEAAGFAADLAAAMDARAGVLGQRAARETRWAPPYVARQLREPVGQLPSQRHHKRIVTATADFQQLSQRERQQTGAGYGGGAAPGLLFVPGQARHQGGGARPGSEPM